MSNDTNASAKIMLVGFSDRQRELFSQLFKRSEYEGFALVGTGHVDIAIIDLDAANSDQYLAEFRSSHSETPVISVSLKPQPQESSYWLAKPINAQALKNLLIKLSTQSYHSNPGVNTVKAIPSIPTAQTADFLRGNNNLLITKRCPASDLSFHEKAETEQYKTEDYLEGKLKRAAKYLATNGTPLQLTGHLHGEMLPGSLYLLPNQNLAITDLKSHILRALSIVNLNSQGSHLEFVPFTDTIPLLSTTTPWETLLWQISLWTSRGRLQHNISPQQPLQLKQWPNFTQLSEFPHALKLAACLTQNALTPNEIAAKLSIPLPYVFTFLSATNSLGLLTQQNTHQIAQKKHPKTAVRNMLQRMLKRLTME